MHNIRNKIEEQLKQGKKDFVIYPFGAMGMQIQDILNRVYNIKESLILDNNLSKYNDKIKNISYLPTIDCSKYIFLIATYNNDLHDELINSISDYVPKENIVDFLPTRSWSKTVCGKYSYGPLCNHFLVQTVGAFCSFALGSDVVLNHPIDYISTHVFLLGDDDIRAPYHECKNENWYFPNVIPKGVNHKFKRITIGNDVWLGKNVTITNSANIGNGVIAAAGAIITKDVPDYAIVAGIPGRVIRFRYTPEQIEKINSIAWWDWPDEKIRNFYNDFYDDIDSFIEKHYK